MLIEYIEIENFKRFGEKQRVPLAHPAVLVGPNNCGKTSAIQAIALWSPAVKVWHEARARSSAKDRTAAQINRLAMTAVPIPRTRLLWHQGKVRTGSARSQAMAMRTQKASECGTRRPRDGGPGPSQERAGVVSRLACETGGHDDGRCCEACCSTPGARVA